VEQTKEYFPKIDTQNKTSFPVEATQYIPQIRLDLSFHSGTNAAK
jgi:hypothetical protein